MMDWPKREKLTRVRLEKLGSKASFFIVAATSSRRCQHDGNIFRAVLLVKVAKARGPDEMSVVGHYGKVIFFGLHLWEGDNVLRMREYYARVVFDEVRELMPADARILDIGGEKGTFCRVISEKVAAAINIDPDLRAYKRSAAELSTRDEDRVWPDSVVGIAEDLPFRDEAFDAVFCRSVLEHLSPEEQESALDEMYRVTKKGGLCYIAIPPWYNPYAGHALRPFHYLPFATARKLSLLLYKHTGINSVARKIGPGAQSYADVRLFPITFKRMMRMIMQSGFHIRAMRDTHFRLHFLTKIPLIRELLIPLATFIAEK
jgi:SAM-dependent methyltransferase